MKKLLATVLCLIMVLALCACGSTASAPAASEAPSAAEPAAPAEGEAASEATGWEDVEPITISFAHANAITETNNIMVDNWMNAVIEASGGKISFDYYPGGQLGTYVEIIEQVDTGAVDMSITDLSLFESYVPEFGIMYSPFIIDSYDHAEAVCYGEAGDLIKSYVASDTNTYLLGFIMNGKRIVDTTVAINSVEDCKGVVIRVPEAQVYSDTFNLIGMSPTPMSLTDTYTAIQTGTVQGFECPAQAIYNGGYHTIAPYIWKSGHMYSFQGYTANQAFWDGLPEIARTTMLQCWEDLQDEYNEMLIADEDNIYAKMVEEGCTITEVDRQVLLDLCSDYWQTKAESIGDRAVDFLNAINAAR